MLVIGSKTVTTGESLQSVSVISDGAIYYLPHTPWLCKPQPSIHASPWKENVLDHQILINWGMRGLRLRFSIQWSSALSWGLFFLLPDTYIESSSDPSLLCRLVNDLKIIRTGTSGSLGVIWGPITNVCVFFISGFNHLYNYHFLMNCQSKTHSKIFINLGLNCGTNEIS